MFFRLHVFAHRVTADPLNSRGGRRRSNANPLNRPWVYYQPPAGPPKDPDPTRFIFALSLEHASSAGLPDFILVCSCRFRLTELRKCQETAVLSGFRYIVGSTHTDTCTLTLNHRPSQARTATPGLLLPRKISWHSTRRYALVVVIFSLSG